MIATSFVAAMSVGLQVAHLQNGLTVIVEPGKEKLAAIRFCARFDTNDPIELGGGEVLAIALMRETDPLEVVNLRKMAWAAGGDLVTAIDGQPVTSFDDMLIYMARYTSPGDTVELTVLRDGTERQVDLTLGRRPR